MSKGLQIRTVGIISKPRKEDIATVVPELLSWLKSKKLRVLYDRETAKCIGKGGEVRRERLAARVDLLIVLGGDGTLLAAARAIGENHVPVLAVNLGSLGFLSSVTLTELYPVLENVLKGKHRISERIMLHAEVLREGKIIERYRALNDAVLNKGALARILEIDLQIDGGYVCTYRADGLIVATPTGSTAYSLSAGGPILHPRLGAFVLTPICPHALTNRPLVIPDNMRLDIDWRAGEEPVYLTLDGQEGVEIKRGDRIALSKAANKLLLLRPVKKAYFEILRTKLKWGER